MVKKAENIIVGISIGDLNGIGSEVILKTFEDNRMLELCTPVIFANAKPPKAGVNRTSLLQSTVTPLRPHTQSLR